MLMPHAYNTAIAPVGKILAFGPHWNEEQSSNFIKSYCVARSTYCWGKVDYS